jgi:hypothetical protein
MPSLFCGEWLHWKPENLLNWYKTFSGVICWTRWRKLEMVFHEVQFAICVPSVLVSLVEGPNTSFVLESTAVNTSVP